MYTNVIVLNIDVSTANVYVSNACASLLCVLMFIVYSLFLILCSPPPRGLYPRLFDFRRFDNHQ